MSLYQDHEGTHRELAQASRDGEHPSDEKRRLAYRNGEHLPAVCPRCAGNPEGGCRDCGVSS